FGRGGARSPWSCERGNQAGPKDRSRHAGGRSSADGERERMMNRAVVCRVAWFFAALSWVMVSGCTSRAPEFEPNTLAMAEVELAPAHAEQTEQALAGLFGTPDEPRVPPGTELDLAKLQRAAG